MIKIEPDNKTRWEDAIYDAFDLLGTTPIDPPDGEKVRDMLAARYGVDEADIETAYFHGFTRKRGGLKK